MVLYPTDRIIIFASGVAITENDPLMLQAQGRRCSRSPRKRESPKENGNPRAIDRGRVIMIKTKYFKKSGIAFSENNNGSKKNHAATTHISIVEQASNRPRRDCFRYFSDNQLPNPEKTSILARMLAKPYILSSRKNVAFPIR